jgi:hypothetical protein
VTAEKTHTLPLPPVAVGMARLGGFSLLIFGSKKTA